MGRNSFSSLILLLLGFAFLLTNFGYIPAELWTQTLSFWPVILIVIALDLMFTKNGSPRLLITSLILIFALPYILQGTGLPFNLNFLNTAGASKSLPLEKKLGTLIGARVNLDLKTGNVTINSLEKISTLLVKGDLGYNPLGKEPTVNFDPRDGVANLDIASSGSSLPVDLSGADWKLSFSQVVPLEMTIRTTGGKHTLNLVDLDVPKLTLDLGKTEAQITLANRPLKAEITATEGVVTITTPAEASVKLEIPEGSQVDIATRFGKSGEGYVTDEFDKAKDKIEIKITPGTAKVVVN